MQACDGLDKLIGGIIKESLILEGGGTEDADVVESMEVICFALSPLFNK